MDTKKVWFITGASKGLGLSLAKQLLQQGHQVAATSRNTAELMLAIGEEAPGFLPLQVNLVDEASVAQAVQKTYDTFGQIDVVINNAGYGIGGSIEELTDQETRESFDVNVFGTLNVIRMVMPLLRARQSGHIINISSIAGIAPSTGWAIYAAAKFAVAGLSEVLADDVSAFGIKVTVVAPGAFRTNFLAPESLVLAKTPIDAYQAVKASHAKYIEMNGAQTGDPDKAAAAMIQIVSMPNPPRYLLLGEDAFQRAFNKLDWLKGEFHSWETLTRSTDFNI